MIAHDHLPILKSNILSSGVRYSLTAMQSRIIALAIAKMTAERAPILLNVKDFSDTPDYAKIKKSAFGLLEIIFEIEDENTGVWQGFHFASVDIFQKQGLFEITFTEKVYPHLQNLKSSFTKYLYGNIKHFRGSHSLRIYEFCKQYLTIGRRKMTIERLKTLLKLEKNYARFSNFKAKVLIPSLQEINKFSDIYVDYEEERQGNKEVIALVFIINPNKHTEEKDLQAVLELELPPSAESSSSALVIDGSVIEQSSEMRIAPKPVDPFFEKLMTMFGLSKIAIERLVSQYGKEKIEAKIVLAHSVVGLSNLKNPAGWLKSALEEDYQLTPAQKQAAEAKIKKEQAAQQAREMAEARQKERQELLDNLEKTETDHTAAGYVQALLDMQEIEAVLVKSLKIMNNAAYIETNAFNRHVEGKVMTALKNRREIILKKLGVTKCYLFTASTNVVQTPTGDWCMEGGYSEISSS